MLGHAKSGRGKTMNADSNDTTPDKKGKTTRKADTTKLAINNTGKGKGKAKTTIKSKRENDTAPATEA